MKQLLFCLTLFASAAAFANPTVVEYPREGMTVKLLSTDKIQMAEEEVNIKLPPIGRIYYCCTLPAQYDCRFTFKNLGPEKVSAKIGFPLVEDRFYKKKFVESLYKFSASRKGVPFELEYNEGDEDGVYSNIFSWDMEFEPNETAVVDLSYQMPGLFLKCPLGVSTYNWNSSYGREYLNALNQSMSYMFFYITETGKGWSGDIEKATFTVDVSEFEKSISECGDIFVKRYTDIYRGMEIDETKEDDDEYVDEGSNEDAKSNEERDFEKAVKNGQMIVNVSPGEWDTIDDGGVKKLRFTASPFNPGGVIEVGYYFTIIPKTADTLDIVMRYALEWYKGSWQYMRDFHDNVGTIPEYCHKAALKNTADVILEFYGIESGNEDIKGFLKKQVWYPVKEPREIDPQLKEALLKYSAFKKQASDGQIGI